MAQRSPTVVDVALHPPYRVTIGPGVLEQIGAATAGFSRVAWLADARACGLHRGRLRSLAAAPGLEISAGESAKSFAGLERVLEFLAAQGLDRRSLLVTFGGGTILDLGGLAASLFKRGLAVVHLPTTLLAQVDASVGGKTAINLAAGKNLAGTFHQPHAVFADTGVLATLDETDWRAGLGEVLKTALVAGESEFARLEDLAPQLGSAPAAAQSGAIDDLVAMCVRTKAAVVASDPEERGARRGLNLGHTFAHGIEHACGYRVPHGLAVAVGLRLAVRASAHLGRLAEPGLEARLMGLLAGLGLPASLAELAAFHAGVAPSAERILAGMAQDKKGEVGAPELVLPVRPGELELGVRVEGEHLLEILRGA